MRAIVKPLVFALLAIALAATIWRVIALLLEPNPTSTSSNSPTPTALDITGCYVNWNDNNKYTLEILTFAENKFTAYVGYYNDGFDSSSGDYLGTFRNHVLDGIYSFVAEGSESRRELVFRYVDGKFLAGFGDYQMVDGVEKLTTIQSVKWYEKYTYSPASDCYPPK